MWKKLRTKILLSHARHTVVEDDVVLPNGEHIKYLRFENKGDAASVVCVKDDMLLVQKEHSYPIGTTLYQFPGGKIEAGESPEQAARRELLEESNLVAGALKNLGYFYFDNRRSDAKLHIFLATECHAGDGKPDKEEFIESTWIPIASFAALIAAGGIQNSTMLAAWALYTHKK